MFCCMGSQDNVLYIFQNNMCKSLTVIISYSQGIFSSNFSKPAPINPLLTYCFLHFQDTWSLWYWKSYLIALKLVRLFDIIWFLETEPSTGSCSYGLAIDTFWSNMKEITHSRMCSHCVISHASGVVRHKAKPGAFYRPEKWYCT